MSQIELKVPDIGGHENVDIIAVEIQVGNTVAVEDTLITLETDKATMDVPAEAAGVVKEVRVKVGGTISEGLFGDQPSLRMAAGAALIVLATLLAAARKAPAAQGDTSRCAH